MLSSRLPEDKLCGVSTQYQYGGYPGSNSMCSVNNNPRSPICLGVNAPNYFFIRGVNRIFQGIGSHDRHQPLYGTEYSIISTYTYG
jgi:hypothetical protein